MILAGAWRAKPRAEVSGEGVEIAAEAIGGEGRDDARNQTQLEVVNDGEGVGFGATADVGEANQNGGVDAFGEQPQVHFNAAGSVLR
jgi:hypothetical protein